jgi:Effector-associated domain 11
MNKLQNYWIIVTIIVTFIILIQIVSPKYENNRIIPFLWFIVSIMPTSVCIFKKHYRLNSIFLGFYSCLLLGILLFEPIITQITKVTGINILLCSAVIIVICQIILLLSRATDETIPRLKDLSGEKNQGLKRQGNSKINFKKLKDLIANDCVQEFFKELEQNRDLYPEKNYQELLELRSAYTVQKNEKRLNLLGHEHVRIDAAKTTHNLLELLNEIEKSCNSIE